MRTMEPIRCLRRAEEMLEFDRVNSIFNLFNTTDKRKLTGNRPSRNPANRLPKFALHFIMFVWGKKLWSSCLITWKSELNGLNLIQILFCVTSRRNREKNLSLMKLYARFSSLSRGRSTFKIEVEISVKNLLFLQVEKLRHPPSFRNVLLRRPQKSGSCNQN